MKYCQYCGSQMEDDDLFCAKCGQSTAPNAHQPQPANSQAETFQLLAKIFMIISTIAGAFALIPLCWMLPMTLHYCTAVKEHRPVSLAFKICSLIFVSQIAGIFMLLDTESTQNF